MIGVDISDGITAHTKGTIGPMTDADPNIPPTGEETRESGGVTVEKPTPEGMVTAADRLLPPFLLVQAWEPDAYDEVLLDWWGEGYLMECGSVHADVRLAEHDHGRVLALVVYDGEDWIEECRAIAGT